MRHPAGAARKTGLSRRGVEEFNPKSEFDMGNTRPGVYRRLLASLTAIIMISAVSLPNASFAQAVTSGTIEVRVTDSTGAALPGATATLTNAETGFLRTGVSDDRGVFQFLLVPVANNYELRAELSGFGTAVISGIRVDPGTQVRNAVLRSPDRYNEWFNHARHGRHSDGGSAVGHQELR
jgi:hypothetical protein